METRKAGNIFSCSFPENAGKKKTLGSIYKGRKCQRQVASTSGNHLSTRKIDFLGFHHVLYHFPSGSECLVVGKQGLTKTRPLRKFQSELKKIIVVHFSQQMFP